MPRTYTRDGAFVKVTAQDDRARILTGTNLRRAAVSATPTAIISNLPTAFPAYRVVQIAGNAIARNTNESTRFPTLADNATPSVRWRLRSGANTRLSKMPSLTMNAMRDASATRTSEP